MIRFLMLVGPGEAEMAVDTLSHALQLYPAASACVRDDATQDGTFEALENFATLHPKRLCLLRNDTPQGYLGCAVSIFLSLEHTWRAHPHLEMVIKLDPDACILRPGLDELARKKFAEFGPGMLGSYRIAPSGAIRDHSMHTRSMLKDLLMLGRDLQTGRLRFGAPFYLRYLVRALGHGYVPGHSVLGGMYILHADTVSAAGKARYWASIPEHAACHTKMEDVLVSLGVKAVGHSLIDINNPASGDVRTWLQYQPPLPWSAEQIAGRNYLAIHPVKNSPEGRKLRADLREILAPELSS